jgi:hypothetical protein
MINSIFRAPNDNFTYDLFQRSIKTLSAEYEAYYIWSANVDAFNELVERTNFVKPNIVIGIKDLLDLWLDYNYWEDNATAGVHKLADMAQRHWEKNFIIFSSVEYLNVEFESLGINNIQVIPWGGDITNQANLYPNVDPVIYKNFNSNNIFVSLNRHPRAHRLVLLSYLFGNGYNDYGHITYIGQNQYDLPDCILDKISWQFEDRHAKVRQSILNGYKKFYNNKELQIVEYGEIYPTPNDNVDNFVKRLRPLYQNSFVEIVAESSFTAPSFMLTEKTLNSVYGCNFPIILSGVGTISHLRDIGFDMFDDVIDHSYDLIANPIDRIITAIENNRTLLTNAEYTKQNWKNNRYRFESNINLAQTNMYKWFQQQTISKFNSVKWL